MREALIKWESRWFTVTGNQERLTFLITTSLILFDCLFKSRQSFGKESACNAEDPCLIPGSGISAGEDIGYPLWCPWASLVAQLVKNLPVCRRPGLGRSPGEGKGYPLQYSSLDNSMGCIVHGVAKSRTLLSIFHLLEFKLHEGRKLDLFVYWHFQQVEYL